jgi:hypothetical protein
MSPIRRVNYWNLAPILKLLNGRRYKREAKSLIELGHIHASKCGVPIRYEIKNGFVSLDISPDQGKSYLNYLCGNLSESFQANSHDLVHSMATIEAIIRTKNHLIY